MIIEKSPHHILNSNKAENVNVIEKNVKDTGPDKANSDEFSFWSWFKGLVNPLQNLPIVSGIYSSVNSENEESDRDLVQNSLGGFLYGGPIGAIVGFGNWAFNKIFDKTPTEMALDASGISEIWKDDKLQGELKQVANKKIDDNLKLHIQYASNISSVAEVSYDKIKNSKQEKIASLSDTLIKEKKINLDEIKINTDVKNKENISKELNLVLEENFNKENKIDNGTVNANNKNNLKFREINFTYPTWKPEEKIRPGKNIEFLKKHYEKLGEGGLKNELKVNA